MVPVLAFSLQDQVEKYGAYVGIAAFLGLAVLTLLYFAQARELKRLRDWAGRAPERAQELEARVVAQAEEVRRAPAPVPERSGAVGPARPVEQPAPAAAPAPASGNGRQAGAPAPMGPRPAVATAAAAAAAAVQAAPAASAAQPAPAEAGGATADRPAAPAAGDDRAAADPSGGDDAAPDRPGAPGGGEGPAVAEPPPSPAGDAPDTEDRPAVKRAANGAGAEPPPIPRATPRPQLPRRAPAAAPLRSATTRSATPPPRRAPARPAARQDSMAGRMALFAVLAVVVIGAGAFAATQLFGGDPDGDQTPAPNVTTDPRATPEQGGGGGAAGGDAAAARPETVVVVLNGTPVEGLASRTRDSLLERGFSDAEGMIRIETNTDQTRQDSVVLYADGQRRMARDVASVLGIEGAPESIDPETQALADSTDVTGELAAEVVVVLGADQAP